MTIGAIEGAPPPSLGNRTALGLFVVLLIVYVVQTQLTEYVQTDLDYRQPYFLFFTTHVFFMAILPLHLLFLRLTTSTPISEHLHSLHRTVISTYLNPSTPIEKRVSIWGPYLRFGTLILALTLGVTAPSLLWYSAVSLTSISSVTALFNTNAFWTYLLSLIMLHDSFRWPRLGAVLLAVGGVILDAYGGACDTPVSDGPLGEKLPPASPLLGNLLAFLASVASSLFQVLYKKYATTPAALSPSGAGSPYGALPTSEESSVQDVHDAEPLEHHPLTTSPRLPFALHANYITSLLGVGTVLILWIPFPILNYNGLEEFRLPPSLYVTTCIVGIATCGVTFNAVFMILLGVWGPIVTSVGSLMTTVLVLMLDFMLGGCVPPGSWVGCSLIAVAFGVLAWDVASEHRR